ncbi:MAG: hypothetical protein ACXW2C_12235 [Acidimicrobiia bacterium]
MTEPNLLMPNLLILDDDGEQVTLDATEAASLLSFTGDLERATVSACPSCRSRVVAAVALVDLLADTPPHPRTGELIDLADEAPTLHLYVADVATACTHRTWRDPGFDEWCDVVNEPDPRFRRRAQ